MSTFGSAYPPFDEDEYAREAADRRGGQELRRRPAPAAGDQIISCNMRDVTSVSIGTYNTGPLTIVNYVVTDYNDDTTVFSPNLTTGVLSILALGTYLATFHIRWGAAFVGGHKAQISFNGLWFKINTNKHEAYGYAASTGAGVIPILEMVATGAMRLSSLTGSPSITGTVQQDSGVSQTLATASLHVSRISNP